MRHVTVDFETDMIENRPDYPPVPVGVALTGPGIKPVYMAWGHPWENNCSRAETIKKLRSVWDKPLLFHNAAFDMEVAQKHLGLKLPRQWDDTLLLAYLSDPRAPSLSLKPMAERILGLPPDEQSALKEWILINIPEAKRKPSTWGAYISRAPGGLVGKYARGDVTRTEKLYKHFYKDVAAAGMLKAYERERKQILIKLKMENPGLRVAPKLKRELPAWRRALTDTESNIRKYLKQPADFNPNSGKQLAEALVKQKKLKRVVMTENGNIRTSRPVLEEQCNDKKLLELLSLQSVLSTYLGTFIEPWVRAFEKNDGLIFPTYNTVRSTDEYGKSGGVGTRTGRYSSSNPNFENIPANVEESKNKAQLLMLQDFLLKGYKLNFAGLRDYIVPRQGRVFVSRDYDQQELRILAHFEDGELLARYLENPKLDVHAFARDEIHRLMNIFYERKSVKGTVFGTLYGIGVEKLGSMLDMNSNEARKLKKAVLAAVPGIEWLDGELQERARRNLPIYTWGGRRYFAEPDQWRKEPDGSERRWRLWYKLLNLLIQGSAADATKQAMIQINEACDDRYFNLMIPIHDELLAEIDKAHVKKQNRLMKEAMEDLDFDLPMTTSVKTGTGSWAKLKEAKE